MTIIGGPAAQDTPDWSPDQGNTPATSPGPAYPQRSGGSGEPLSLTGIFSSIRRTGRWEVPPSVSVVGGFSETVLDLREAVITSPVVEVKVYDAFSNCKIIVPPGVGVDLGSGASVFSNEKSDYQGVADPGMWRLRVLHYGAFSNTEVITLAAGESEPKWWKRS